MLLRNNLAIRTFGSMLSFFSASVDSTAQTGHLGSWQEELYQMIKILKDQYFAELNDLYNKISMKLQHVDNQIPPQKPADQYEKMKGFKMMLEPTLHFLQINKGSIQPGLKEKIPVYERQIINILNSQRRKPVPTPGQQLFQQSGGPAPNSNISQQQKPLQGLQQHDNRTNQMSQANLPSMMSTGVQSSSAAGVQHVPTLQATNFGVPTTQQNVANGSQPGSNLEAAQGNNFNSVQHGSMSGTLQQGSTGPMQGAMNSQQQSNTNMLPHNSMSTKQLNANSMQTNTSSLQQLKQQQHEHHMKHQMLQLLQAKQMLQQPLQMQQHLQKQQQMQMQVQQLSGNDMNELNSRNVAASKPGIYLQLGQRCNYYQQLKQGGALPISSPQNLQASSPQISHHSPQVDQHNLMPSQPKTGTPLHSANSPFVPSPSPPVAPSPIPVDLDKPLSNLSSLSNTGQGGHQQTSLAPQTQSIAVNTPGISASPLLAEFTSADGSQANAPTQVLSKSCAAERPLDRLLKACS